MRYDRAGACCAPLSLVCFGRALVALRSAVPWLVRTLYITVVLCGSAPGACKSLRDVRSVPCVRSELLHR